MKEMETQSKPSLKLQAYQYLKTKILNCEYRPNEFLNEQKLCAEMGNISRTPMRDALGRLEQEGLITILPKKGLMVSGITEEDVHSMFEMRLLVEPYALRTYGDRIPREALENYTELMHHPERISDFCESDDGFHELLMSTLPNKYLRSAYDRITGLNTRFRIMTGKVSMIWPATGTARQTPCSTIWSWPATRQRASSRSSACGKHLNAKISRVIRRGIFFVTVRPVPPAGGPAMHGWAASGGTRSRICRSAHSAGPSRCLGSTRSTAF